MPAIPIINTSGNCGILCRNAIISFKNFSNFFNFPSRNPYCIHVRTNRKQGVLQIKVNYYAGAAQGDAECAAAVGYCCEMDPRGSNLPLALAWYQHAAKAGSAWAMEKVATFYEEGYGCTANRALADACRETLKYMR